MGEIDRKALVGRHNPQVFSWNPQSPLSVGNGNFAFTADFTGLQSCIDSTEGTIPRCTMSQWGFHAYHDAPADNLGLSRAQYHCADRMVGYMTKSAGQEDLFDSLRINPHRFHLANIGFYLKSVSKDPLTFARYPTADLLNNHITNIVQHLDLWTGCLYSSFMHDGQPVMVQTVCHPAMDMLSVRICSPLLSEGNIGLDLRFPYGSHTMDGANWAMDEHHSTIVRKRSVNTYLVERIMDDVVYFVHLDFSQQGQVRCVQEGVHHWVFTTDTDTMEFSISFLPAQEDCALPGFRETMFESALWWEDYWNKGAAVSFEGSTDIRAMELERRIVLSQYLLAIQSLGSLPPAETGLTCNSWYGKYHLEMHVWHALHGLLWGRVTLVEKSLPWYNEILAGAGKRAAEQGYTGVRWPKMTDPSGNDSPSPIGPLLCWQQPHIILFSEILHRVNPSDRILSEYAERVFATAEFMADYVVWDEKASRFVLGPPLIPAQENHAPEITLNPCFELEYWRWALKTAIQWKIRLGQVVPEKWTGVVTNLSICAIDQQTHCYAAHENCTDTYGKFAVDHPSMLLAYGFLPLQSINVQVMSNTVDAVLKNWRLETMWGWDFPAIAMTLARLGRCEEAVDVLLMDSPKNIYLPNGHNRQEGHSLLPLYLPGNGALLLSVGMMAGGWDGSTSYAPGFPQGDGFHLACEGFARYI